MVINIAARVASRNLLPVAGEQYIYSSFWLAPSYMHIPLFYFGSSKLPAPLSLQQSIMFVVRRRIAPLFIAIYGGIDILREAFALRQCHRAPEVRRWVAFARIECAHVSLIYCLISRLSRNIARRSRHRIFEYEAAMRQAVCGGFEPDARQSMHWECGRI